MSLGESLQVKPAQGTIYVFMVSPGWSDKGDSLEEGEGRAECGGGLRW